VIVVIGGPVTTEMSAARSARHLEQHAMYVPVYKPEIVDKGSLVFDDEMGVVIAHDEEDLAQIVAQETEKIDVGLMKRMGIVWP
jgi:hypothetical protein